MTKILYRETVKTPLGEFLIFSTQKGVRRIFFSIEDDNYQQWLLKVDKKFGIKELEQESDGGKQIREYTAGTRQQFDCALDLQGTPFQRKVWETLTKIPYGTTRSYSWVANKIKKPKSVRAVGRANGDNPIPIIIPCHRIIGKNGKLTGFGGGIPLKKKLIEHEFVSKHFKRD
jgi:O-6-methylguanine DNA methyltransferase